MNGLADPSAIIQTFWVDDGLGSLVRLHQTVALIDAKNFPSKFKSDRLAKEEEKSETSLLSEEPEVSFTERELLMRQLIYADKILLNKVDLIPATDK
jgi:G3E family GTPase